MGNNPAAPVYAAKDVNFDFWGFNQGAQFTIDVYADDGWKTINGQQGKTPIASYTTTLARTLFTFAKAAAEGFGVYPLINTQPSRNTMELADDFRGNGSQLVFGWSAPKPTLVRAPPMAPVTLYSFAQGPKVGATGGFPLVRSASTYAALSAASNSTTLPIVGKPAGASATIYGEFALTYADRRGLEVLLGFRFQ